MNRERIKKTCKRPFYGITKYVGRHNPELLVRIRFFARFHRKMNLKHPHDLNEKILYLSLRTDTTEWTRLADKYAVRDYVSKKLGDEYLVKLLGVWEQASAIDFDSLPDSFVLKSNNGSGDIIVVEDKSVLNYAKLQRKLAKMLKTNYGEQEGGKHYMRIPHKIIAEELLKNDATSGRYSTSLIDYKFWCFNGKAEYVFVCTNRDKYGFDLLLYDIDWNAHPEYSVVSDNHRRGEVIPKPDNFEDMISAAEKLAKGFPVVRVDLYNISGKIYFGEMTFTSLGGMMDYFTREFLNLAGNKIRLK